METRYCIEYVNPRHPLRDNGSINVRYDRVLTLEQAIHDLTLIESFGAKILNLYMGNVVDGKTGEWNPVPMIVDEDDWFTTDWLKSLNKLVEVKEVDLDESARHYLLYEHISPLNEVLHQADLKVEMQYHKDIEDAYKAGLELGLKVKKGE